MQYADAVHRCMLKPMLMYSYYAIVCLTDPERMTVGINMLCNLPR